MNTVQLPASKACSTTLTNVLNSGETAFIGQCGRGSVHSLYLIVYEHIVQANCPQKTWDVDSCLVTVDCYVDVEMVVKEKTR